MKKEIFIVASTILLLIGCNDKVNKEPTKKLPSFPTAEGEGAQTAGGRAGRVIEVTNLNADGVGSFKFACESTGKRTVVFRVGGTIDLGGQDIVITNDNITIAGQTATGDGIQIKNGGLRVNASEVIIRYLRLRSGPSGGSGDSLSIGSPNRHERKKNIIVDHVSAFWGVDETLDAGSFNDNITIQWSMIAEGLHCSIYDDNGEGESWEPCKEVDGKSVWAHSRGTMISEDSRNITLHHNLIYRNYKRNPLIQSSDVDMVNNVIVNYQYQAYIEPFKAKVQANFVGNYFRSYLHIRPPIRLFHNNKVFDSNSGVYYKDNYDAVYRSDNNQTETDIRVLHFTEESNDSDGQIKDMSTPYPFALVETQSVHEAYSLVLDKVGANYPIRDEADRRVIGVVRSGKAPETFVNDPIEVGGWPTLLGGIAPIDSDQDGMPDSWEKNNGLNPDNKEDRNSKNLSTVGYTNLEVYLNGLVENQ